MPKLGKFSTFEKSAAHNDSNFKMESFKVSHDSLFKNTLRILHEGIRHDLSIQTQDEILTCNRAFLELYPSLKEKIDDSSQMLQLQDYKGEVIRAFLEFVYTGKVTIVKKSILEEFQNCAKSLDIAFTIEISKGEIPTSNRKVYQIVVHFSGNYLMYLNIFPFFVCAVRKVPKARIWDLVRWQMETFYAYSVIRFTLQRALL